MAENQIKQPPRRHGSGGHYLENHHGDYHFAIPKGMMGYAGSVPNFSAKNIAELWILQTLKNSEKDPSGEIWYGKSLMRQIRKNTEIPDTFKGYNISEGIIFGLMKEWLETGIIEAVESRLVSGAKRESNMIKITQKGIEYLDQIKREHQANVVGAAMIMNRLHFDLFGVGLLAAPDATTRLGDGELPAVVMPPAPNGR